MRSMLGTVDLTFVYQLLEAVAAGDPGQLLQVVEKMSEHAPDYEGSLDELISLVHRMAVAQVVPDAIDNSWGDAQRVAALAASVSAEDTQLFYQVALNGKRDMAYSPDPRSGFEMLLLRMLAFRPAAVIDDSLSAEDLQPVATPAPTAAVEVGPGVKKPHDAPAAEPAIASVPQPVRQTPPAELVEPASQPLPQEAGEPGPSLRPTVAKEAPAEAPGDFAQLREDNWAQLLDKLGLLGMVLSIASNCQLVEVQGTALKFILDEGNASLFNSGHSDKIRLALQNYFNRELSVSIEVGVPPGETPAMRHARAVRERQQEAVAEIEADQQLHSLITRFDGELDRSSIAPMDS